MRLHVLTLSHQLAAQCEARMPAVPLHRSAHAGPGSRSARQHDSERPAVPLLRLLSGEGAAAAEQTIPSVYNRLSDRLPVTG